MNRELERTAKRLAAERKKLFDNVGDARFDDKQSQQHKAKIEAKALSQWDIENIFDTHYSTIGDGGDGVKLMTESDFRSAITELLLKLNLPTPPNTK